MLDSKQELISKLTTARHQMEELQTYVAALEAQLDENRPHSESLNRNKESLEEMNRFLQSTLNGLPYSTCVLDSDGTILFANYQWKKFADENESPSRTYYLGVNYLTVCRSASGPMSEEAAFVAARINAVIAGEQDEFYLEYPCHSPSEQRWFMLRVTSFAEPTPRRVVVAHINITQRKLAEDALRRSKSQYQLLADNMTDVIWILDTSSMRFTYVSPSVELLRGYTPDEVLLQPIEEVMTPASLSMINSSLPDRLRAFLAGDPGAISNIHEIQQICKDGSLVWTEVVTKLLKDDSGKIQILGVSRNITERKQAEDRIRKLNRTLAVLSDVNQVIVRIRSISALFDTICQIAVEKGSFRMAWIGMLDTAANKVEPVSHAGIVGNYLNKLDIVMDDQPRGHGPTARVIRMGDHVICNDIEHDPSMLVSKDEALALDYRAMASFPLKIGDQIRGAISLYSSELNFFR